MPLSESDGLRLYWAPGDLWIFPVGDGYGIATGVGFERQIIKIPKGAYAR